MTRLEMLNPLSPICRSIAVLDQGDESVFSQYTDIIHDPDGTFLSVIIRTQGGRIEMLQDVLTGLLAQRDQDFEVILICHRAPEENVKRVSRLVAEQPESLRRRIRLLTMDSGERGAPVNRGFAEARGRYAAVLDDDDLVLDHWVEAFHRAEKGHEGMILHAGVYAQPWRTLPEDADGRTRITADGDTDSEYCIPYNTFRQQTQNYCPFMGLAFPLMLFRDFHLALDESLTTTEDWDYLLRTAGIAGVWEVGENTAIYRLWNTREASRQMYDRAEWMRNYHRIFERMDTLPLILSPAEAKLYRDEEAGMGDPDKRRSAFLKKAYLYWKGEGEDYSDRRFMQAVVTYRKGAIQARFRLAGKRAEDIRRIRIDPAKDGMLTLSGVRVHLLYADGRERVLTERGVTECNAIREEDRLMFLTEDPYMEFPAEEGLSEVLFEARIGYECTPRMAQWIADLTADARWAAAHRNQAQLYAERNGTYTAEMCLEIHSVYRNGDYHAVFIVPESWSGIAAVRFDPTEVEMSVLSGVEIRVAYGLQEDSDPDEVNVSLAECMLEGGFQTGDGFAFPGRNPWIRIPVDRERTLRRVTVSGKISFVDEERMETLLAGATRVPGYRPLLEEMARQRTRKEWEKQKPAEDEGGWMK